MSTTMNFLVEKGLIKDDMNSFKRLLHKMWFALYPRSRRTKGSCAFEHVFLGEVKNGKVNGFHNWLFFLVEEMKGDINYYGFSKCFGFGRGRGGILKTIFEWEGSLKPVSSIFMGLSPELEMALYTICVLLKPDDGCTVSLGGKTLDIQTYIFKNNGLKYLGTAFPNI
jgi:poly(U)-specific endoribonuclease